MKAQLVEFWKDEEGATAIEYALIAGLIAVIVIAMFGTLGDKLESMFRAIGKVLDDNHPT